MLRQELIEVNHKREKTTGRYVGAPDWIGGDTKKLNVLRKKLKALALEGERGRMWYENSSKAILEITGGDIAEAEKIVSLIAIYSPNATVPANTSMALTAYYQWKAGHKINAGFSASDKKAEELLRNNKPWSGIKTNSFYQNLMVEIDPSRLDTGVATMDMWMAIAFDYGDKALDQGPKYKFSEREMQRLASELGWKPHQVQAAIWTAMKGRVDAIRGELKKQELKLGIGRLVTKTDPITGKESEIYEVIPDKKYEHFKLAHKIAMEYTLTPEDINASKYDFSDAMRERTIQMSWEATPSTSTGRSLPGIHGASLKQKFEYLQAVQDVLTENGRDVIADLAGLPQGTTANGFSAWLGDIGAGAQTFVPVPSSGFGKTRAIKPSAVEILDLASAIRGYVLEQDAIVYHTPVWDDAKIRHNGLQLSASRPLTKEEMQTMYSAIHQKFGTWDLAPGYRPDGARIINFTSIQNAEFQKGMIEVIEALPKLFGGGTIEIETFRSDGNYISNDWTKDTNGEGYLKRIKSKQPDIQQRVADLRSRVEAVNRKFEAKYGWDKPASGLLKQSEVPAERGGVGGYQGRINSTLKGAPIVQGATGADSKLVGVAEQYAKDNGINFRRQAEFAIVDEERASRIADAYEAMPHDPQDPAVKEAYQNLIRQTLLQYRALEAAGYKFYFYDENSDPYAGNPWNAMRDLRQNQRMAVFSSEAGFGSSNENNLSVNDNPLLAETGLFWSYGSPDGPAKRVLANDLFRAVHDAFGHGLEGAGFRARGEENAWQAHVRLFTGSAIGALTSETRGQNSWLNYGPHGKSNQTAKVTETIFADQKTGLMPEWTWKEGLVSDAPNLFLSQSAQNKPARGWFDPKQLKAMLGSKSDITTFFHELAHYYLTVYSRVASDPQSPSQVREDMDAILSWFGIAGETPEQRLATWNAMTLEEQRPHHEAFAYNKEIYVSEGKSPSIEMQGVFERFGQFIKRIYISIRDDLNAIYKQEFGTDLPMMTGEIRRVMDRMIATDEQIRSAEERRNMENIFKDQELSGMDDAQWASYQQMRAEATQKSVSELNEQSLAATTWASRLKAKKVKELEAEQEELRSEIRKQVKKEVESRNVYRAIKFLKYGILQTAGGEEVEFTGSNKLNANAVKLMVPKENMDKFGSGKNGMVALDGYHPDIVSERFNYSSGDELILAILDAKPMDEVIDGITEDRMEIENGELNSPQAIEAAADKAVHNEARVKLVAVELRWLTKATQPVRAMIAAAKSVAKQMLETKRLRDIKPGDYASAAARAAKESQTAYFASQSAETAAKTAYTRHYNKMIAEGAEEAKAVEMATKVSDEALAKAESRSEAHKKKYGKMKPSEVAAQAKRSQLLQEQLALEANDAIDQVKKSLKYLRNVLSDKNVQKIGADNSDQIALLLERFELKNISLKEMDKRTSLANWIASQLELGLEVDISKELIEQTNKIPYRNLTLSEFNDLVDAVKTIEYMGKNENAVLTAAKKAAFKETKDEIVKSIIENAGDRKASTRTPKSGTIGAVTNQVTRFLAAQFKAASVVRILDGGKDDGLLWNYLIRPANKSGDKETSMKATATEAASKILNPFFKSGRMGGKGKFFVSVNESLNREEKLVIALNMGNEGNIQRMLDGYGWTLEQVIPILESMTAEELNAVQEIWDLFGTYKNEISAMSRKIFGKDLDFVEPTPIQIKSASGEVVSLRGGYYPAKYDPIASSKAQNLDEAEIAKQPLKAAYISATTSRGYSKQRATKVVGQPLIRNLSALYSGLNEVIHDLSWREWTIDANKLMRDNAFDEEIRNRYGSLFTDQLKSWIQDVAAGDKAMDTGMDIPLNFLRQGISSAGLGFNLQSAALQVTGFNQSIIRVGPKYIGYGIMQVMKRGTGAFQEVNELSEFMANRSRTQFRELNELRNRVQGQSAAMKRVRMGTYFLMMKMQRSVDVPTWIGAYAKQLEINPDEQLARDIADQTVIDTQGSGMVKDLSGVERGGAGAKLFTVFYGYMNTVYNMAAVETMTEKKRGKLAAKYVMLFVVPVVLSYALKQLLKPKKDDDDEFDWEQMAKDLSIEQIQYLMGTMVVAREFSQIAKTMIDPSAPSMGYGGPAGVRMIGDTYTAATQIGQGEFDAAFRKSAINLIGDATGLPSAQVNRTIDGIEALMEDETTDIRAPLFGVRK